MKKTLLTATAAFALGAISTSGLGIDLGDALQGLVPAAKAQTQGNGQPQARSGSGGGGSQAGGSSSGRASSIDATIFRGKGERVIIILEDEDSDRPAWAGGNPELNPNSGSGGGQPSGAGTVKGDEYGDLIILERDPVTGLPLVNEDGEYLVCLDSACTETVPTVDLEVPEGVVPIEVDFGRAAVARSPEKVIDKALDDALAKLTTDGVVISTDAAGRITYTVDGVTSTIDSPLENLALYIDLMVGLSSEYLTASEEALGDLATLETAAALFAGVADKTGDINIDYVVYQNLIVDLATTDSYYDFSDLSYTRDYPEDYSYWVSIDGADPVTMTLNVNDYLQAVNGDLPSATDYTALFAAAADDALEVIELTHTQIYTEILPGTVQ